MKQSDLGKSLNPNVYLSLQRCGSGSALLWETGSGPRITEKSWIRIRIKFEIQNEARSDPGPH